MALARCAAVTICIWTLDARAFAEEKAVPPPSSKAEATKPAHKRSAKENAQSGAPVAASRPQSPANNAMEPGAAAQTRPRAIREDNVRKAPLASLPPPDTTRPPPRLPEAPREKMRACAIEWSKLKLEARDPMPLWRDFGAQCLKR